MTDDERTELIASADLCKEHGLDLAETVLRHEIGRQPDAFRDGQLFHVRNRMVAMELPITMTFWGVSLIEFTREELMKVMAFVLQKRKDFLGEDFTRYPLNSTETYSSFRALFPESENTA